MVNKLTNQSIFKPGEGFTLLEVVVAIGVIVTGVMAGLTLTAYNLNISVASERKLVAANLAREGVEVVRGIRDSNWLAGQAWETGLTDPLIYRFSADFDAVQNSWFLTGVGVDLENCSACALYLDPVTGVFSHNNLDILTAYSRQVYFKQICWQEITATEIILGAGVICADQGDELIGLEVHSQVSWVETGSPKELEIVDRLYNWR